MAVAQLGVVELVIGHTILILHDGQGAQAFGQHGQFLGVNADFTGLGAEDKSLHAHDVAQVEQALEDGIVHLLIVAGADVIARHIDLHTSLGVLQLHERGLSHDASAHDTARNRYLARLGIVVEFSFYISRKSVGYILCCMVWLDTHGTQLIQAVAPNDFLFTKFQYVHFVYSESNLGTNLEKIF